MAGSMSMALLDGKRESALAINESTSRSRCSCSATADTLASRACIHSHSRIMGENQLPTLAMRR